MQITIKRTIAQELNCFNIRVQLLSKALRLAIICLVLGVITIIICQNDFGITDTSSMAYLFLEMIFFLFAFFIFKRVYLNKKLYKTFSRSALQDYGSLETYSTVCIDDKYFCYESVNKYYKLSWPSLSTYQVYKGNLILMIDAISNSFVIKPDELPPAEFNELLLFVSQNLKLKKK